MKGECTQIIKLMDKYTPAKVQRHTKQKISTQAVRTSHYSTVTESMDAIYICVAMYIDI